MLSLCASGQPGFDQNDEAVVWVAWSGRREGWKGKPGWPQPDFETLVEFPNAAIQE